MGVPCRSKVGGKRLRVIDFRAILCERDNAHTLWYVLGVIVQKRAERCRYQSFASHVDTAQSERGKGTNGSKSVNYDLFLFRLSLSLIILLQNYPA